MDAFYASVESRDNPELRGKPLAVGGNIESDIIGGNAIEPELPGFETSFDIAILCEPGESRTHRRLRAS